MNIIRQATNGVLLTVKDFDVKITRNSTDSMLVEVQVLDCLLRDKTHPLIAITVCKLFGGPEKVWTQGKPYMDTIFETQEQLDIEAEEEYTLELLETKQTEAVKTGGAE